MKLGVRGKLFLSASVLWLLALVPAGVVLEQSLRTQLQGRIRSELERIAAIGCALSEGRPRTAGIAELEPLADLLGRAGRVRVTLIGRDGQVLGDSDLTPAEVRSVENHGRRPEVLEALAERRGSSRRFSTTLDTDMLYVAVACQGPGPLLVARAAEPLDRVEGAVTRQRWILLLAGALTLGAALLLGGLASQLYSRTLRRLVKSARELAEGRGGRRLAVPAQDEIGGLVGSLNRMSEELQQLVATLAAERDRFKAVLEGMADGVLALAADGRISQANQAARDLLGLAQPPEGRTLLETIRVPALHELLQRAAAGAPVEAEIELPGDPPRRLRARASLQRSGEGRVVLLRDVTDLRRLQTVRQDFVANASHELRTPVSVIRANAETLLAGALDEPARAREFVEATLRQAERLSALIADLLDISRIDSGRFELARRPVSVLRVVEAALAELRPVAADRGLELGTEVPAGLAVEADEQALGQVLRNLLDNAIKYTQAGGRVRVRARAEDGRVRLEVEDDGPGISPRHRQRVFERFYRVDTGRSRAMGGTGLGLSIVKNLVEAMGGEVGMEPASPRGSLFWIRLPAA